MSRSRAKTGPPAAALLTALLLAGCTGTAGFDGPDPLTGGPPIQRRTSPAPSLVAGLSSNPPASAAPAPTGQLPPVPTPSTATSQAALAAGVSQPLDSGRDLRIGAPTAFTQEQTQQPLWRGSDAAAPAGARLSDPQVSGASIAPLATGPVTPPVSPAVLQPASVPTTPGVVLTGGGAQADTLDQALKQLNTGRTVTWQRLETVDKGGWFFQCAIANPAKPDNEFNYKASGATELEAVRKVLDQIALEKH
jgi:hypothetical protein